MNTLVTSQGSIFFAFIFIGIVIGYIFDLFRVLRKSFHTNDIITYIEDVIFWIITCFILTFSVYILNNGNLRIYIFLAVIIGACLYLLTISKYLLILNTKIITLIKSIIKIIIETITFPIKWIYYVLYKYIFQQFKTLLNKLIKNISKNKRKMLKYIKK